MPKTSGKIIKILANFYYIKDSNGKVWECFAKKRLQKEGKNLFVGDTVEIEISNESQGSISNVKERRNKLLKPSVANFDQVLVVFSTKSPTFDEGNLDRYLSYIKYNFPEEEVVICINKIDIETIDIGKTYKDFKIVYISALKNLGVKDLKEVLNNKTTVLTGPSGVGKSSLIKALIPGFKIEIGELNSYQKGKHTTRNVQLVSIDKNSFLVDTPGFSQIDFSGYDAMKIRDSFPELKILSCAFKDCLFNSCNFDDNCELENKDALKEIAPSRFESYIKILDEAQSEKIYSKKEEKKSKKSGGKNKSRTIPKIKKEDREKSRKRSKQELNEKDFWEQN